MNYLFKESKTKSLFRRLCSRPVLVITFAVAIVAAAVIASTTIAKKNVLRSANLQDAASGGEDSTGRIDSLRPSVSSAMAAPSFEPSSHSIGQSQAPREGDGSSWLEPRSQPLDSLHSTVAPNTSPAVSKRNARPSSSPVATPIVSDESLPGVLLEITQSPSMSTSATQTGQAIPKVPSQSPAMGPTENSSHSSNAQSIQARRANMTSAPLEKPTSSPREQPSRDWSGIATLSPTAHKKLRPISLPSNLPTSLPSPAEEGSSTPGAAKTTFYAIADTPYYEANEPLLMKHMLTLPPDAEFLIHLGDIKNSASPCSLDRYRKVEQILSLSPVPVFIIPGDNEWNDCDIPSEAWENWKETFLRYDQRHWNAFANVTRQPNRTENFAFVRGRTLFIGLNIVGGRIHSGTEWVARLEAQYHWTRELVESHRFEDGNDYDIGAVVVFGHANAWDKGNAEPYSRFSRFFDPFRQYLKQVVRGALPVMYMHGDGHSWKYELNFLSTENTLQVQLTSHSNELPLKVIVDSSELGEASTTSSVFQLDRFRNGTKLHRGAV